MAKLNSQIDRQNEILQKYIDISFKLKKVANMTDLLVFGVTRSQVRHHFGNMTNLMSIATKREKKLKKFLTTKENILIQEKNEIYKILNIKDLK